MNIKEKIEEFKKFFFSEEPTTPAIPPVEAEPIKQTVTHETTEGLLLTIDKMEVGGIVTNGELPVDDSTYTLKECGTFTTKNGVIETITMPAPAAPVAPVVDEEMKKELTEVKAQFAAVKSEKEKFEASLNAKIEKQNKAIEMLFEALEQVGKMSSEAPLEPTKDWEKMSTLEKRRAAKQNY